MNLGDFCLFDLKVEVVYHFWNFGNAPGLIWSGMSRKPPARPIG
jgi:hypothetical protein